MIISKWILPLGLLTGVLMSGIPFDSIGQTNGTQISLWPKGAPGYENRRGEPEQAQDYWIKNIHNPSITVFLPPKELATGAAIVIFPGGGHRLLVYKSEGLEPAAYLNSLGVAAIVLKYRLFREPNSPYTLEREVRADAYRAIRMVRSNASLWNIDTSRVGVMGFSAGGEVAAQVAYSAGEGDAQASDPIDRLNGRPDFQILIYPGPLGVPDSLPSYTPPAFMLAADDDPCCALPVVSLLQKYRLAKIPVEVHILSQGGHGFNMGNRSNLKAVQNWRARLADWLSDMSLLQAKSKGGELKKE